MGWRLIEVDTVNNEKKGISSDNSFTEYKDSPKIDYILNLRFSELASHNMGIKIYSEIIGAELWFCTNDSIASQVKRDDPDSVIYTIDELKKLISAKVKSDDLKAINNAKKVFPSAKITSLEYRRNKNVLSLKNKES